MAKKKKLARTSLRPIITEIDKLKRRLKEQEEGANAIETIRLKIGVKKLERLSRTTRLMCRGLFI